ncbi:MAG: hypothetical protein ACYCW6_07810 [Candidatus Xenobia bacterium]
MITATVSQPAGVNALRAAASSQPSDAWTESSPDKHKLAYKASYGAISGAEDMVRIGSGAASLGTIGSSLGAFQVPSAYSGAIGAAGVVGGTFTFIDGASKTKTGAINRDRPACIDGTLEMAQGIATTVAASGLGAIPAGIAVGCMAARGVYFVGHKIHQHFQKPAGPPQRLPQPAGAPGVNEVPAGKPVVGPDDPNHHKSGFESPYANATAAGQFVTLAGNSGNIVGVLDRGNPSHWWGALGLVGATVSFANGAYMARVSSVNHNRAGVIDGSLGMLQGAANAAVAMGGGWPAVIATAGVFGFREYRQIKEQMDQLKG